MLKASSHKLLEIACFDLESCFIAQQAGADRIEFCSDYSSGGVTPLRDDILNVRKGLSIPLHVIIRPRKGNFVYSPEEIEAMKRDILFCKEHGVDGLVFGVLTSVHEIDVPANKALLDICAGLPCTFHRAVDACPDQDKAYDDLIKLGFQKVLTSGGEANALEGIETLKRIQEKYGKEITIMPGGGVRSSNITQLTEQTGCVEFHSAARVNGTINREEIKILKEKLT